MQKKKKNNTLSLTFLQVKHLYLCFGTLNISLLSSKKKHLLFYYVNYMYIYLEINCHTFSLIKNNVYTSLEAFVLFHCLLLLRICVDLCPKLALDDDKRFFILFSQQKP